MREALEAAKLGAEYNRQAFGPDDDWAPVIVIKDKDGDVYPADVSKGFATDQHKSLFFASILPTMLGLVEAVEAALVTSCWMVTVTQENAREILDETGRHYAEGAKRPSERDDRVEVLVISYAAARGDEETLMAKINRQPGQPPTLDWEWWEREIGADADSSAMSFSGRVLDALRAGVR